MTTTCRTDEWRDTSCRQFGLDLLEHLESVLAFRLPFMQGRGQRVAAGCAILAANLDLADIQRFELSVAARFHDIGMLGVRDSVLVKRALTPQELAHIYLHTDLGGRLVARVFPDLPGAAEAIWWHHERPDGKGPHHLTAEDIPDFAGMIAVVGAMEAMANGRPHRAAMTPEAILAELERHRGTQFLPRVLDWLRPAADRVYRAVLSPEGAKRADLAARAPAARRTDVPPAPADARSAPAPTTPPAPSARPEPPPPTPAHRPAAVTSPPAPAKSLDDCQPVISRSDLTRIIREGLEVHPLGANVQAVLSVAGNPRCSVEDVAREVSRDHAMAIRILRLANSSVYSRGKPVTDLKAAIARIGIAELRNLVLSLEVLERFDPELTRHIDARLFWEHLLGTGLIASSLARHLPSRPSGDCFLWGMMHDVGRLMLLERIPDEYLTVLTNADQTGASLELVELRQLGMTHCDVLEQAMKHWGFPHDLIVPAVNHHQSVAQIRRLGPQHAPAAAIVAIANRLAHALLLGDSGNPVLRPIDDLLDIAGLNPDAIAEVVETAAAETNELKWTIMARTHAEAWPDAGARLRDSLDRPLNAVTLAPEPKTDVFRMFFEQVGQPGAGTPNLAVLFASQPAAIEDLARRCEAAEAEHDTGPLPVVVVLAKGKPDPNHPWLAARRTALFSGTVRIPALLAAAASLVGPTQQ